MITPTAEKSVEDIKSIEKHSRRLDMSQNRIQGISGGKNSDSVGKTGPTGIRTQVARIRTLSDNQLHYGTSWPPRKNE
jgi:hypothetical protein